MHALWNDWLGRQVTPFVIRVYPCTVWDFTYIFLSLCVWVGYNTHSRTFLLTAWGGVPIYLSGDIAPKVHALLISNHGPALDFIASLSFTTAVGTYVCESNTRLFRV